MGSKLGFWSTGAAALVLVTTACGKKAQEPDSSVVGSAAPVTLQATPDRGKVLFVRCASCHEIKPGAPTKIGPNLAGVVGRKGGSLPGYQYSPAMMKQQPVWTEENLDRWLIGPSQLIPGTSMAFAGLPDPADRKVLIAYLKSPR